MFSKTKTAPAANAATLSAAPAAAKKGVPSVISMDMHILGNMVSEGLIDVDGSVEGNIRADQATIRANGKIKGDIVAQTVHVYGQVNGLIRAHSVHLYSSSHVEGVIMYQSMSVEDGAFVDGKFKKIQEGSTQEEHPGFEDGGEGFIESPAGMPGNLRLIS